MRTIKERIMTVGHFAWSRALLLQIILQDEGIDCFIVPKETVLPRGYVDIRVKEVDIEKALKIIKTSLDNLDTTKEKAFERIKTVRRILVPVDFSDISLNACRFAATLANKYKAELKLLHVYYNPSFDISPYSDHYSYQIKLVESLREIEKSARESMLKLENRMHSWCEREGFTQCTISTKLINGLSADEILKYSESYNPSMLIIGTRGMTHDNYKAFGRIASDILENSKIPVLALPVGSAKTIRDIKNLLYITDFDPDDYAAINRLIQFMSPFGIAIHCVHISFLEKKSWEKVKMEELMEHLQTQYIDTDIRFDNILSDKVINGIETYIRHNEINALAMTTRKRSLLEKLIVPNFARKIFSETGKPLLVFQAKED